jgi:hypothetical protein
MVDGKLSIVEEARAVIDQAAAELGVSSEQLLTTTIMRHLSNGDDAPNVLRSHSCEIPTHSDRLGA